MKHERILLGTIICMALALLAMFSLHPALGLALLVCWAGAGCALLILLIHWPRDPLMPSRPEVRKAAPLRTAICMAMALVPLVFIMHEYPWSYVLSGRIFTSPFDRIWVGFVLDQPTIGKWLFWFSFFSAVVLPFVAVVRWLSDRGTRSGYWAFAIPTAALCLCLLSLLTLGFFMLLKYIAAMGFTPKRIYGLVYGIGGYIVILGFFYWAVRIPKKVVS